MSSFRHFTTAQKTGPSSRQQKLRRLSKKTLPKDKLETLIDIVLNNNKFVKETRNTSHKPLDLLILLILNQSTTDSLADKAFSELKTKYKNYESILLESNIEKLTETIKVCGLAPTKAKYILNALEHLHQKGWLDCNLKFIKTMSDAQAIEAIMEIKGVGIKSASCLLMFSFGRGTFPIDTHLFRIFKRIGGIFPENTTVERAHKLIQPRIQGENAFKVHVSLIEHGRNICTAPKRPLCNECYVSSICESFQEQFS